MKAKSFSWSTTDVRSLLPPHWVRNVSRAAGRARPGVLYPTSVTSREGSREMQIATLSLAGAELVACLPWLDLLYRTVLRELAQVVSGDRPVLPAVGAGQYHGVILNVLRGNSMRYEATSIQIQ